MVLDNTLQKEMPSQMLKENNPNKGINEAQPFQMAVQEATTESTLSTSHDNRFHVATDWFGNVMDAPDKNNPTRPKYERPLDTVRSFEYAISRDYGELADGTVSHRNSSYSAYHPSVVAGGGSRDSVQYGPSGGHGGTTPSQQQYYASSGKTTPYSPDPRNSPISNSAYRQQQQPQRKAGGPPMEYNNGNYNSHQQQQRYPYQQQPSPPTTPRQPAYRFSTTSETPERQINNGGTIGALTPPASAKQEKGKKSGWKRFSLGGKTK